MVIQAWNEMTKSNIQDVNCFIHSFSLLSLSPFFFLSSRIYFSHFLTLKPFFSNFPWDSLSLFIPFLSLSVFWSMYQKSESIKLKRKTNRIMKDRNRGIPTFALVTMSTFCCFLEGEERKRLEREKIKVRERERVRQRLPIRYFSIYFLFDPIVLFKLYKNENTFWNERKTK